MPSSAAPPRSSVKENCSPVLLWAAKILFLHAERACQDRHTLPLDVAIAEICLQGARVGALIAKLKAAGMTEHVGVSLETELGRVAQPGHHLAPARRSEEPRSDVNTNGDGGSWSRLSRRSAPQVDAASATEGEPFLARLGWFALWSTRRPVRLRRLRRRPRSACADRT